MDHSEVAGAATWNGSLEKPRKLGVVTRSALARSISQRVLLRELAGAAVSIEPALRRSERENFAFEETDEPSTLRTCVPAPLADANRERLVRRLAELPLASQPLEITERAVATDDWPEQWKQFWRIERAGERIVVRPSWEPYEASDGEIVIELDPGQAFGTGQHESTRLMLAALERELAAGMRVLDLGAGSGILAIAAARLGASEVVGLDLDASTVPVARDNVVRNGVQNIVRLAAGTLDGASGGSDPGDRGRQHIRPRGGQYLLGRHRSARAAHRRCVAERRNIRRSGFIASTTDEVRAALRAVRPARCDARRRGRVALHHRDEGRLWHCGRRVTRRIYLEPADFGGDEIILRDERARRLVAVLRQRKGDALQVFDGGGHERAATVASVTREAVTLRLGDAVEALAESAVPVTLLCAVPRGDRGDWIVEKATELGVARIVLIAAERGVMQPGAGRIERWRRVAIEAAEQCGRALVPEIVPESESRRSESRRSSRGPTPRFPGVASRSWRTRSVPARPVRRSVRRSPPSMRRASRDWRLHRS